MHSESKTETIQNRINHNEKNIVKAHEYLQNGTHAQWRGFRPFFVPKVRDGKELPPHKDWVRNVFIPNQESAIRKAEKLLDRLEHNE